MGDLTKNFSKGEIACPLSGDSRISPRLMEKMQQVRDILGRGVILTSGVRSVQHNKNVGGVDGSAHVPRDLEDGEGEVCHAVDIRCSSSRDRYEMLPLCFSRFNRIGIGRDFIHVDTDSTKPSNVAFHYYSSKHKA